ERLGGTVHTNGDGTVAIFRGGRQPGLTGWRSFVDLVHADGACTRCFDDCHLGHPGSCGLFGFEEQTGLEGIDCPYDRSSVPTKPLRLDDFAPPLRELASRVRFEKICFADPALARLQPFEHVECDMPSVAWLDSSMKKLRATPGHEGDFVKFIPDFAEDLERA